MPPCAPRFWKAVAAELMLFDAAGAYFAVARQEYAPFALVNGRNEVFLSNRLITLIALDT
jgi:hypothetical protein